MRKVHLLKNSRIGINSQYPKPISTARSTLSKSTEAVDARSSRRKVKIRYPARLFLDGRCLNNMFPDWFDVLGTSRLCGLDTTSPRKEDLCPKPKTETLVQ
ncbi:hypothetical protein DPMN_088946 [Dreissena polymorpha]|uniref:Uncharacterized protein n=1 Tax=Dreissena polymorpha TaxID=45954 RepID=A0A9D4QWZ2_DREPO|nr:hypothetical protein DPMN_088946 [Dreissena polymorpha]